VLISGSLFSRPLGVRLVATCRLHPPSRGHLRRPQRGWARRRLLRECERVNWIRTRARLRLDHTRAVHMHELREKIP
jgi:hypothetical protein